MVPCHGDLALPALDREPERCRQLDRDPRPGVHGGCLYGLSAGVRPSFGSFVTIWKPLHKPVQMPYSLDVWNVRTHVLPNCDSRGIVCRVKQPTQRDNYRRGRGRRGAARGWEGLSEATLMATSAWPCSLNPAIARPIVPPAPHPRTWAISRIARTGQRIGNGEAIERMRPVQVDPAFPPPASRPRVGAIMEILLNERNGRHRVRMNTDAADKVHLSECMRRHPDHTKRNTIEVATGS